ncbi:MAG TPA: hypothetical protein VF039_07260 [Longimicrobiales bacterium]
MNRSFRTVALLSVGLAAACGDAPTEPNALRAAEHARVVLDVPVALPALADVESMDAADFAQAIADVGVWLDAAQGRLIAESATEAELAKLHEGREALRHAAELEKIGDRAGAVALLTEAEARLVAATARALTALEIAAADRAFAACDAAAQDVAITRGERLLAHAREAQAEGDFERAVQRAHYAEMLFARACAGATPIEGAKR